MAIQRYSSNELNEILLNANKKLETTNTEIAIMKTDLQKKLNIIRSEREYSDLILANFKMGLFPTDPNMIPLATIKNNSQEVYGPVVHAAFIKEPLNVFNLKVAGTGEYFFRDDIDVAVNGIKKESYKDVLKHDSLAKELFYDEYINPIVTITLEAPIISKQLGSTKFNVVELDAFLNGAFDIINFKVYKINEDGTTNSTPFTYQVSSAGKLRFILPEKTSFSKIEMTIRITYGFIKNGTKIYPFGLKHLYLYDADFRADSYTVLTLKTDRLFESISEDVTIKMPNKRLYSTLTEQKIKVYLNNENGILSDQISTSDENQTNVIAKDTNILYVKVPLKNETLIGMKFSTTLR